MFKRPLIHPTSIVDEDCQLGSGTVLGEDCSVAPGTHIDGAVFGDRCKIMHNVAMGPGFKFGNDCFVGRV